MARSLPVAKLMYTKHRQCFTAVLVIADAPCALALSAPFTYGNILRILGKNKIYLRDYPPLKKLADVNTIVLIRPER
nr:hypothetical protein [Bacteroidota bacterium]